MLYTQQLTKFFDFRVYKEQRHLTFKYKKGKNKNEKY